MGVSENNGTPKSSILIGFSIINHPFWGTTILETPKFYKSGDSLMALHAKVLEHSVDGRNPKQPPGMFKTL